MIFSGDIKIQTWALRCAKHRTGRGQFGPRSFQGHGVSKNVILKKARLIVGEDPLIMGHLLP